MWVIIVGEFHGFQTHEITIFVQVVRWQTGWNRSKVFSEAIKHVLQERAGDGFAMLIARVVELCGDGREKTGNGKLRDCRV